MFLKRLELNNVRSFEKAVVEFALVSEDGVPLARQPKGRSRQWTLLLGQNGTGKSTILRSAALLMAGSDALPGILQEAGSWVRKGSKVASIKGLIQTDAGKERLFELVLDRTMSLSDLFAHNRETLSALDEALKRATRNWFTAGYGASRRLSRAGASSAWASGQSFTNPRIEAVQTLFSADAALHPLEAWAVDLDYKQGREGLDQIRETLARLLPGVTFERIDRESKQLIFLTPDGELPLGQLSDGFQNMAAWCGDLLFRITTAFKDYSQPLEARGLLLIDEVDLHLHPVWQRRLRAFLTESLPNLQVIASSHSPLTAHQCGPGELYVVRRNKPDGPAETSAYPGTPNRLFVHQFLAGLCLMSRL